MRSFAAAVLLVLTAACATGKRPAEAPSIVGSYQLVRIDNHALPARSPTEPNVTVIAGALILGRGGAFALTLNASNSPEVPATQATLRGSYEESGNTLTVTPTNAAPVVYQALRAGTQLTLRDPQGHRWEFVAR
ncbi:MAG TPA: hypothetical protein VJT67_04595 [Longimicrobiaceae bacterium]|nr:hypothetical protein [Longimicrobiaceae bacterium]